MFVVIRTIFRFIKKEIRGRELTAWLVFWVLVTAAVVWPTGTDYLANTVGVGRGVDLLLYISVLVIFYLVFRILVRLEKIDRQITKVVRKVALDEDDK